MTEIMLNSGDGLLGRVIDADGKALDGLDAPTDVRPIAFATLTPIATGTTKPWETGIKVIDVYAPIARGTTIALQASPGVGMIVMICELIYRLGQQHDGCAVFAMLDTERNEHSETVGQLRESGVEQRTVVLTGRYDAAPAQRQRLAHAAVTIAEDFATRGRDVLLVLDDGLAIAETVELLRGRAQTIAGGSLTILLCSWRHADAGPASGQGAAPLLEATDVQLVLSRELAQQRIWPAVDACLSSSRLLVEGQAPTQQLRTVAAARALLQADKPTLSAIERERAHKLLLFQSQPFFVAEPFTARPAEYVARQVSIDTFEQIVAGTYDQTEPDLLRFVGKV